MNQKGRQKTFQLSKSKNANIFPSFPPPPPPPRPLYNKMSCVSPVPSSFLFPAVSSSCLYLLTISPLPRRAITCPAFFSWALPRLQKVLLFQTLCSTLSNLYLYFASNGFGIVFGQNKNLLILIISNRRFRRFFKQKSIKDARDAFSRHTMEKFT